MHPERTAVAAVLCPSERVVHSPGPSPPCPLDRGGLPRSARPSMEMPASAGMDGSWTAEEDVVQWLVDNFSIGLDPLPAALKEHGLAASFPTSACWWRHPGWESRHIIFTSPSDQVNGRPVTSPSLPVTQAWAATSPSPPRTTPSYWCPPSASLNLVPGSSTAPGRCSLPPGSERTPDIQALAQPPRPAVPAQLQGPEVHEPAGAAPCLLDYLTGWDSRTVIEETYRGAGGRPDIQNAESVVRSHGGRGDGPELPPYTQSALALRAQHRALRHLGRIG